MDEEKISIVFKHSLYEKHGTLPRLDALTFQVSTGELIEYSQMTEVDEDLALNFRAQDKIQNDNDYVQDLTDEELLEALKDPDSVVMFYTPVGLEVGFNYEDGWVTVTLKEQAL